MTEMYASSCLPRRLTSRSSMSTAHGTAAGGCTAPESAASMDVRAKLDHRACLDDVQGQCAIAAPERHAPRLLGGVRTSTSHANHERNRWALASIAASWPRSWEAQACTPASARAAREEWASRGAASLLRGPAECPKMKRITISATALGSAHSQLRSGTRASAYSHGSSPERKTAR